MKMTIRLRSTAVAVLLLANVEAFKFLSNFKASSLLPRPGALLKRREAAQTYGDKKLAVITGASSGIGLAATAALLATGEYHVFGAVRDVQAMRSIAKDEDFPTDDFTPLEVDLGSFESVRSFCRVLEKAQLNKPISRLICNAATYTPGETPEWSTDGIERTLQVNFLSHFLMASLVLPGMAMAADPRVIFVGGARAVDGVAVYPRADLSTLEGLKAGAKAPIAMLDGFRYHGAKAYKDSKLCAQMLAYALHARYHKQTGICFSCVHAGAISDSRHLAGKPPLESSTALPSFVRSLVQFELSSMRSLGLGQDMHADGLHAEAAPVTTAQAAARLFQVAHDGRCSKSGVAWSWREGQAARDAAEAAAQESPDASAASAAARAQQGGRAGWEAIYESEPSAGLVDVTDALWKHSTAVTQASWLPAYQPRSPCPTLVVVGAVTKAMNAKEEAKRTLEGESIHSGLEGAGKKKKSGLRSKVLGGIGAALDAVAGHTVGRAAKLAQDKLLGDMVDEALEGSYQDTLDKELDERIHQVLGNGGMALTTADEAAGVANQ